MHVINHTVGVSYGLAASCAALDRTFGMAVNENMDTPVHTLTHAHMDKPHNICPDKAVM